MDSFGSVKDGVAPPDRSNSNSAPPALQISSDSLFAWKVEYASIFSDIRAHEDYYQFYEQNKQRGKALPPPLDPTPFLFDFEDDDRRGRRPTASNGMPATAHHHHSNSAPIVSEPSPPPTSGHRGIPTDVRPIPIKTAHGKLLEREGIQIPVPTKGGGSLWQPSPSNGSVGSYEENILLSRMQDRFDVTYSSSPSAQIVLGAANYILRDEDLGQNTQDSDSNTGTKITEVTPNKADMSQICRYYAQGYCSRGDKCFYSHDLSSLSPSELAALTSSNPTTTPATPTKKEEPAKPQPAPVVTQPVAQSTPSAPTANPAPTPTKSNTKGTKSASAGSAQNQTPAPTTPSNAGPVSYKAKATSVASPSTATAPARSQTPPNPAPSSSNNAAAPSPTSPRSQDMNFEGLLGRIYHVSKDQQGCRFLQKKLEENNPQVVDTIFREVYDHITELMIDPFGNYLCQKLLEHCNEDQRYLIVEKVSPDLVVISKNMHGTRAVQKMIECLSSPNQIQLIKKALATHVVDLIQDLNGNHVIQRCLNRLASEDNQFIYDAVTTGSNCVQVATHRHGCCVLQRCIDHASTKQKVQLIKEITKNGLVLVQDPYGNYVVQYILELPFPDLVDDLARTFLGNLRILATQKFSSNVIEKCLTVTGPEVRYALIREVLGEKHNFLHMLQDPFANYVIQTAIAVSDPQQHSDLVEAVKPFLPQLRNTPYGKRIQTKITKDGPTFERGHQKFR